MPREYPPRRTLIAVRLAPGTLAEIDEHAAHAPEVDRSTMIRTLLAEALGVRQRRKPKREARAS